MSSTLPLTAPLKITSSAVYAGHPEQLAGLLTSGVAQAVIEIQKTKGGMPLYKALLRCKTLFNGNLPVHIAIDYPNLDLSLVEGADGKSEAHVSLSEQGVFVDEERGRAYLEYLKEVLSFWEEKMEQEVVKIYTDKIPSQKGLLTSDVLALRINPFPGKPFELQSFLQDCRTKSAVPCFKIAFGWILSQEDPRSKEHAWGFKFDLLLYPLYTEVKKRGEEGATKKKRKVIEEAPAVEAVETKDVVA
jgi:hypothetical protein